MCGGVKEELGKEGKLRSADKELGVKRRTWPGCPGEPWKAGGGPRVDSHFPIVAGSSAERVGGREEVPAELQAGEDGPGASRAVGTDPGLKDPHYPQRA